MKIHDRQYGHRCVAGIVQQTNLQPLQVINRIKYPELEARSISNVKCSDICCGGARRDVDGPQIKTIYVICHVNGAQVHPCYIVSKVNGTEVETCDVMRLVEYTLVSAAQITGFVEWRNVQAIDVTRNVYRRNIGSTSESVSDINCTYVQPFSIAFISVGQRADIHPGNAMVMVQNTDVGAGHIFPGPVHGSDIQAVNCTFIPVG